MAAQSSTQCGHARHGADDLSHRSRFALERAFPAAFAIPAVLVFGAVPARRCRREALTSLMAMSDFVFVP
jgi:hypothetical protein